jgi:hypothetical protein
MARVDPLRRGAPGLGPAVALAAAIGLIAGLVEVAPWALLGGDDPSTAVMLVVFLVGLGALAAATGAWLVCRAMNRWPVGRIVGVFGLAIATYVCGILFLPALIALVNVPGVWNGGALPCIRFGGECEAGLHGLDAMRALIGTTMETYGLGLYAVLLLPSAVATLLVPAVVWDVVARRQGWIRSVAAASQAQPPAAELAPR